MRTIMALGVATGLLLAAAPVRAHHAFAAEFDVNKPVTLTGVVSKVEWTNPHMWLHIDVTDASGKIVTWAVEGPPPNTMIRRGVKRNSLPNGIRVTVKGYQAKSNLAVANGQSVIYPDGVTLNFVTPGTGAPGDRPQQSQQP